MDFKAQVLEDMKIFHNPEEFATMTNIWYCGRPYTVPIVIDHEAAQERSRRVDDHGEGISRVETLVYLSLTNLGFVPKRNCMIEIEEAGAVNLYRIMKADHEDGEIILELGAYEEP